MIYVATLEGRYSEHSYVLGVFDSTIKAEIAAKLEIKRRSKKKYLSKTEYKSTIIPVLMNVPLVAWTVEDWDSEEIHDEEDSTSINPFNI